MADDNAVTVKDYWGAKCVSLREDDAGMEHHWWFEVTDDGHWVLFSEVIHYDDNGRHYVDTNEMYVPPVVEVELQDQYGVEKLYHGDDFR